MKDADADLREGKGLVISDNDRLARAIVLVLHSCLDVEMVELGDSAREWKTLPDVDPRLIVLALSSADSKPFSLLSRASLGARIGQVPVLIVSERAFSCDRGDNVFHVDFPYNPHTLCDTVSEILREPMLTHVDRKDASDSPYLGTLAPDHPTQLHKQAD